MYLIHFQVYKLSIEAACNLTWPSDRVIIQVLDDSTDPVIKVGSNMHLQCKHEDRQKLVSLRC